MTIRIGTLALAITSAGWIAAPAMAHAKPLAVINVAAPGVNCVFNTSCTIVVTDSIGTFNLPGGEGTARLQSRTFLGAAPAAAVGKMGYEYRVDLTKVTGSTAKNCVSKLALDFGPVVKLPYGPNDKYDIFVVTSGGLGSLGIHSASQAGKKIVFTFTSPVCPGATSYFFGLASKTVNPKAGTATISLTLGGTTTTSDRVP
jgi:hypothetical protein